MGLEGIVSPVSLFFFFFASFAALLSCVSRIASLLLTFNAVAAVPCFACSEDIDVHSYYDA